MQSEALLDNRHKAGRREIGKIIEVFVCFRPVISMSGNIEVTLERTKNNFNSNLSVIKFNVFSECRIWKRSRRRRQGRIEYVIDIYNSD